MVPLTKKPPKMLALNRAPETTREKISHKNRDDNYVHRVLGTELLKEYTPQIAQSEHYSLKTYPNDPF